MQAFARILSEILKKKTLMYKLLKYVVTEGLCGSNIKVKCSRYRPSVAQKLGRSIALLFHDRGTRRG